MDFKKKITEKITFKKLFFPAWKLLFRESPLATRTDDSQMKWCQENHATCFIHTQKHNHWTSNISGYTFVRLLHCYGTAISYLLAILSCNFCSVTTQAYTSDSNLPCFSTAAYLYFQSLEKLLSGQAITSNGGQTLRNWLVSCKLLIINIYQY